MLIVVCQPALFYQSYRDFVSVAVAYVDDVASEFNKLNVGNIAITNHIYMMIV